MKESIFSKFHWIIIAYAMFSLFTIYEDTLLEVEQAKMAMEAMQVKAERAKKKLSEVEKFKANLQASRERVNEVVSQIEKIQKQLPTDVNDTQVQQVLGKISSDLRINDPRAIPGQEALNGFYYQKEYEFLAKGTFLQFLIFFEKLGKEERILNVKSLSMQHDTESQRGRFQVLKMKAKVESYRYNQEHNESSGIKEIEAKFQ